MDDFHQEARPQDRSSITVGYFWTFGTTVLPLVSAFFVSMIIARLMGPEVVGFINLTMALCTVFLIVGKFGVEQAASKLISEYRVSAPWRIPRLVSSSVLMRLVFTVPTAVAGTVFARQLAGLFGDTRLIAFFRLSGLLIFAVSFNELAVFLILGLERFRLLFAMRLVMMVLRILLVVGAAVAALEATAIIDAFVVSALLPALWVLIVLLRLRPGVTTPSGGAGNVPGELLRLSVPLAISSASVTIYSLLDKLMLGYFGNATDVGLYSMARNVLETSLFPTFALVMTLRPALAGAYAAGDLRRCSDLVHRSVMHSMVYSATVVVVFACLSKPLIVGLFTERFEPSAELLMISLPLIVMRSIGAAILPSLIAADRAGIYARLTLTGAGCNFVLNAVFIPMWGATGAVVSTLLSYIPVEVLGLLAVAKVIPGYWHTGDITKVLKTAGAMVVVTVVYLVFVTPPGNLVSAVLQALAIVVALVGLLLALGALTVAEIMDLVHPLLKILRRE